jgi:hypothetical protein
VEVLAIIGNVRFLARDEERDKYVKESMGWGGVKEVEGMGPEKWGGKTMIGGEWKKKDL